MAINSDDNNNYEINDNTNVCKDNTTEKTSDIEHWLKDCNPPNRNLKEFSGICRQYFSRNYCKFQAKCSWQHKLPSDFGQRLSSLRLSDLQKSFKYLLNKLPYLLKSSFYWYVVVTLKKGNYQNAVTLLYDIFPLGYLFEKIPFVKTLFSVLISDGLTIEEVTD